MPGFWPSRRNLGLSNVPLLSWKLFDIETAGAAVVVKGDESLRPRDVGEFGAMAVVSAPELAPDLVEKAEGVVGS